MHKSLLILGLLLNKPLHGYKLHRIVRAHGELYADLKKGNLYYLLDRLATQGHLDVQKESGTKGRRGERLIYSLTKKGRDQFYKLLRQVLLSYEQVHTGVEVAVVLLAHLPPAEAFTVLEERRRVVQERRTRMTKELDSVATSGPLADIASDHLISLIDSEIEWLDRSLNHLRTLGWEQGVTETTPKKTEHGK